jgi:hypothetical protein
MSAGRLDKKARCAGIFGTWWCLRHVRLPETLAAFSRQKQYTWHVPQFRLPRRPNNADSMHLLDELNKLFLFKVVVVTFYPILQFNTKTTLCELYLTSYILSSVFRLSTHSSSHIVMSSRSPFSCLAITQDHYHKFPFHIPQA